MKYQPNIVQRFSFIRNVMRRRPSISAAALVILGVCGLSPAYANIVYTQDTNLADFTSTITNYGTFTSGTYDDGSGTCLLGTSCATSYTPTENGILAGAPRVIGGSGWGGGVTVDLGSASASIVVFDNIDHPNTAQDVFQYAISGSTDGSTWTSLFDPTNATAVPGHSGWFTLTAYNGTAPTTVNNTTTGPIVANVGQVGYQEYFNFGGSGYRYYQFNPSAFTTSFEPETELSAVGIAAPSQTILSTAVPEPASVALLGLGLVGLGFSRRKKA